MLSEAANSTLVSVGIHWRRERLHVACAFNSNAGRLHAISGGGKILGWDPLFFDVTIWSAIPVKTRLALPFDPP